MFLIEPLVHHSRIVLGGLRRSLISLPWNLPFHHSSIVLAGIRGVLNWAPLKSPVHHSRIVLEGLRRPLISPPPEIPAHQSSIVLEGLRGVIHWVPLMATKRLILSDSKMQVFQSWNGRKRPITSKLSRPFLQINKKIVNKLSSRPKKPTIKLS